MIAEFSFDYGTTLAPEQIARLAPLVRNPEDLRAPDDKPRVWWPNFTGDIRAVLRAVPELVPKLKLTKADLGPTAFECLGDRLSAIEAKLAGNLDAPASTYNARCSVHVPGLGLLLIDEVSAETDLCTERLQSFLDDGWRILAVCPQPDQRRPDYILGRTKDRAA